MDTVEEEVEVDVGAEVVVMAEEGVVIDSTCPLPFLS